MIYIQSKNTNTDHISCCDAEYSSSVFSTKILIIVELFFTDRVVSSRPRLPGCMIPPVCILIRVLKSRPLLCKVTGEGNTEMKEENSCSENVIKNDEMYFEFCCVKALLMLML